ncbi:probable xyloglucan endotransglucosylase/hydrolase protein 30 [Cynara cardunculus var. scolymus]|uniref:probable xyloglucan endotransglucosylase/hydrolase protein 30 n=1 Tax=Cynara cardunculus var. scolymus TaxID=59895 RepID=UPI000D62F30A|nr:probable xyloglucan endotransglucosylase/hydrolase protein 30 [Cynara cardunculus var. scolymus]
MDRSCSCFRRRRRQFSSPSSETRTTSSLTLSSSVRILLFILCASHVFSGSNPINLAMAFDLNTITFNQGYAPLFSDFNIYRFEDDKSVRLLLNRQSGSGIISMDYYNFGFFSAKIKLPRKYTAGIVVAFYTSNVDMFPTTHDELDMEFLGNVRGKPWRFQTNVYGNGSMVRGREERYRLWFDPSKEFHRYSILWARNKIIFYVDEIPIREILRDENMGGDYPSKPMSSYATIWDASSWATNGGRHKVDYQFEPFTCEFRDLVLQGCPVDPTDATSTNCLDAIDELESSEFATITPRQRQAKKWFREKYMYYSYCYDRLRYPSPLPECPLISSEQELFKNTGRLKNRQRFHRKHRSRGTRRPRNMTAVY